MNKIGAWLIGARGTLATTAVVGARAIVHGLASGGGLVTELPELSSLPLAMFDPATAMKDVQLSGDAEFAQALAFVLQNLRPEPEEELSRFIGDAAAQRLVGFLRASASQWKQIAESMLDNTAHYVVTENPMVVGRDELDSFNQDVNHLRDAVAHIEKRIDRLAALNSAA